MRHLLLAALVFGGCTVLPLPEPKEPEPDNAAECKDACSFYEANDCFEKLEVCSRFEEKDEGVRECLEYISCEQSCLRDPQVYLPRVCE